MFLIGYLKNIEKKFTGDTKTLDISQNITFYINRGFS